MTASSTATTDADRRRAITLLTALLGVALAVSIVHYADNYLNYAEYPQSPTGPDPSASLILAGWFIFTAAGLAGYLLFRRDAGRLALLLLAFYAGSGLVGLGHYTVPGALDMPWWRHAHVVADIACGIAVLAFVVWAWRRRVGSRAGTS